MTQMIMMNADNCETAIKRLTQEILLYHNDLRHQRSIFLTAE